MKNILAIILIGLVFFTSCDTQQDVYDTGVAKAKFDGSMMDYLKSNNENWGLTVEMVERAGLTDMFEGNDPEFPEITFFGVTSWSIQRYLWDIDLDKVSDLSPEECKELLFKHIIKGKFLKEDFKFRDYSLVINHPDQTGYDDLTMLGGNVIRVYLEKEDWGDYPQAGATKMYLWSTILNEHIPIASPNIQPDNGVVHSLSYDYVIGRFF